MKKSNQIFFVLLVITVCFLTSTTTGAVQDNIQQIKGGNETIELYIRGGIGAITFTVVNHGDTEVIAYTHLTGRPAGEVPFGVPPGMTATSRRTTIGFRPVVCSLSAGSASLVRLGVILGVVILFLPIPN